MTTESSHPTSLRALIDTAAGSLWEAMSELDDAWGVRSSDWDVDQTEQTILFTNRDDRSQRVAPVQIIATHEMETGLWRWGWDHPSVLPALRRHAATVRERGVSWEFPQLTLPRLFCGEAQAWELTAIAFEVNSDARGACRTPSGGVHVYTTFGESESV